MNGSDSPDDTLESVDLKAIQIKQLHELSEIRHQLQRLNEHFDTPAEDTSTQYECQCGTVVIESELEQHAEREHNWHSSMGEASLMDLYATKSN